MPLFETDFHWEDLFKPKDDHTSKERRQEARKRIDEAIAAGKKALNTPEFAFYREKLEKAQASIVDSMILYTNEFFRDNVGDMAKYGANMARFMTRITTLRALLNQVESDARKDKHATDA